jgi:hypothetical protein
VILNIYSDAPCLSEREAKSRAVIFVYMGSKHVMSVPAEEKIGAVFLHVK